MNILEVPSAHNNLISQSILLKSVSIIGTGHLGAHFAMGLSKLGVPEIYLYDPDQVEKINISGTPYNVDDIGEFKVEALRKLLLNGNLEKKFIHINKSRVEHAKDLVQITDVYVVATDSIESRIKILEAIEEQTKENTEKKYLIDLRSRSKIAEVHALHCLMMHLFIGIN